MMFGVVVGTYSSIFIAAPMLILLQAAARRSLDGRRGEQPPAAARPSRPDGRAMAEGIVIREAHFPGRAPIDAYGNGGFRFADMSHRGSILCLPSGIHGWEPADPARADAGGFRAVLAEADDIEILLVGTGTRAAAAAARRCARRCAAAGISADPMSTGAAVRTYNVLLAEERAVAAALVAVD